MSSGIFKIVATPIGNIQDISLRAKDALSQADLILAEDTRHSRALFNALGLSIKAKVISCSQQMEEKRIKIVIEHLDIGNEVVLITDAGAPGISDPGSRLVSSVIEHGFRVEVIPGASALTASLMGVGLDCSKFIFLGFLPRKFSAKDKILRKCAATGFALVIFESPLRVLKLLKELFLLLGNRRVVVARELTKIHETFHRGYLGSFLEPAFIEKGECVVVVDAGAELKEEASADEIDGFIDALLNQSVSAKDIATKLTECYGIKKNMAYKMVIDKKTLIKNR